MSFEDSFRNCPHLRNTRDTFQVHSVVEFINFLYIIMFSFVYIVCLSPHGVEGGKKERRERRV